MRALGIVGSLRVASYNKALLRAAVEQAPAGMSVETFDIAPIPPYNQDVEVLGIPEPVAALKRAITEADALLVVSPEYNYGVPGVLKNAIDWASRPPGKSPLNGKPAAIMGASMGTGGTIRMQLALRQTFLFTETYVMVKPEIFVARAQDRFDEQGRLTDDKTREIVKQFMAALGDWARRFPRPA
jgi:chromate reductase, NAD(P)H dehydrogenase (quinone)